jgi:hypothetical protein
MMRQWIEQLEQHDDSAEQADLEPLQRLLEANVARQIPQEHTELLLKLTRQSARFNQFATELLAHSQRDGVDSNVLLDQFKQHLDQLTRDWVLYSWQLPEQLGILMGLFSAQPLPWQEGFEQFAQLLSTLLSNLRPVARPDLIAQMKESLALLERFEQARKHYMAQLSRINAQALERMARQLEGAAVTDIDQLHQLWIESYESAYQQQIGSQEYCAALGEISNAAMALRQGWQRQRDRFCGALGLVTDTRHDELAQRHHQLRRRVRALERELAELRRAVHPKASHKEPNAQDQA